MHDTGTQEISFGGIFDQLEDDERISVRAGDFKVFLAKALSGVGISEPSLAFSYRGIEQEAAVSLERVVEKAAASLGKHLANGVDDEVICDITWWRDDVLKACQHVYGIVLSRDDDGVEDTIDGVLAEIGDGLQDRSTEFGYELIYEYLPEREKVMKLAKRFDDAALAAAADRLIRERWGDGYEILLDDGTVGDEPAFYVAAPRDESERGRCDQPTAVFIEYASDFEGDAYDLCSAAISVTNEVNALAEKERAREEAPTEVADAARAVASASVADACDKTAIHR